MGEKDFLIEYRHVACGGSGHPSALAGGAEIHRTVERAVEGDQQIKVNIRIRGREFFP